MAKGKPGRPKKVIVNFDEENKMEEVKETPQKTQPVTDVSYDELVFREGLQVAMKNLDVRHSKNIPAAVEVAEAYLLVIKARFPK